MENKDDIIDVEFREKDTTESTNNNQTIVVHTEDTNKSYEQQQNYSSNSYSNVKVVKLHPILAVLIFIAIAVIGFFFAGIIAVIICVILGIIILASTVSVLINKFKSK